MKKFFGWWKKLSTVFLHLWIKNSREREIRGLPIGNVTSQIFANIYLNELDQFVKHQLKIKHYFRYTDDFIIINNNPKYLANQLKIISNFLENNLFLQLHPNKVVIRKFRQGVDFLGYVALPHYKILRTKTKNRMFKRLVRKRGLLSAGKLSEEQFRQSLQSYLGLLSHCQGHNVAKKLNKT